MSGCIAALTFAAFLLKCFDDRSVQHSKWHWLLAWHLSYASGPNVFVGAAVRQRCGTRYSVTSISEASQTLYKNYDICSLRLQSQETQPNHFSFPRFSERDGVSFAILYGRLFPQAKHIFFFLATDARETTGFFLVIRFAVQSKAIVIMQWISVKNGEKCHVIFSVEWNRAHEVAAADEKK